MLVPGRLQQHCTTREKATSDQIISYILQKVQNVIDDLWQEAETPTFIDDKQHTHTHLFSPAQLSQAETIHTYR